MAWGSADKRPARQQNGGWQAAANGHRKPEVVFVSSGDFARDFFHKISERSLRSKDVAVIHCGNGVSVDKAELARKIDGAKVVIIGTCKRNSMVKDSPVQQIESFATAEALRSSARIVLFCEYMHEAVLPHLEIARDAKPIAMIQENFTGPAAFLDSFPMGSEFVRVDDTEESLGRMGAAILRQLRRSELSVPAWNWD